EKKKKEKLLNEKKKMSTSGTEKISGGADFSRLNSEIEKINAGIESFGEVRKTFNDMFSQVNEQIGELRAMISDRDRSVKEIEMKAIKAGDLVESVQPEKLMLEVQREHAKFEALKANLESNEEIMNRIMEDLKELRRKFEFFRGMNELVKLSDEVKKELVEIKSIEAEIGVKSEKVEAFYSEIRRKYKTIDMVESDLAQLKATTETHTTDLDTIKIKISNLAEKEDIEKIMKKMEKYTEMLQKVNKSSSLSKDISQLKDLLSILREKGE
ncbi:hypothetical protein K0A97_03460, partial [Patescibacteria group bacterium]|nr:hypothetical protein [Patescibacteria group bacterium]